MRYCLIVPHYNHERQFAEFLPQLLKVGLPCIVLDDGSDEESLSAVRKLVASHEQIELVEHTYNRGKGAAVRSALGFARARGFTHAIQIDADGQHNVNDIGPFIDASRRQPQAFICGRPVFDSSAPKARLYGRKVTDFWVILETWSLKIRDGLCGFRVYPLDAVEKVFDHFFVGARMDFDTEILVKAVWLGVPLQFIDTKVVYPEKSVSHFNYWKDNLALIKLHTRLMLGMLAMAPALLANLLKGSAS